MAPEIRSMLERWLTSDNEFERTFARWQLQENQQEPQTKKNDPAPVPLAESLPLLRLVNACPYRSRDAACGCSGHRCALRVADPIVTHLDCMECVKRYEFT